jgi:hypothetical protein
LVIGSAGVDLLRLQFESAAGVSVNYQRTSRVAPEKADFRPVLACALNAGVSPENPMSTYSERLKDPRWQRRRLEILQRSDFSCERCEATDKTLHVHHKLYRKGAMPWEYADHELHALCEDCHEEEHHIRERLASALAAIDLADIEEVLGYALACHALAEVMGDQELPTEKTWKVTTWWQARGFAMRLLKKMPTEEVDELLEIQQFVGGQIDRNVVFQLAVHGLPGTKKEGQ